MTAKSETVGVVSWVLRWMCDTFGPKLYNDVYSRTCLRCNVPARICRACDTINHENQNCRECGEHWEANL